MDNSTGNWAEHQRFRGISTHTLLAVALALLATGFCQKAALAASQEVYFRLERVEFEPTQVFGKPDGNCKSVVNLLEATRRRVSVEVKDLVKDCNNYVRGNYSIRVPPDVIRQGQAIELHNIVRSTGKTGYNYYSFGVSTWSGCKIATRKLIENAAVSGGHGDDAPKVAVEHVVIDDLVGGGCGDDDFFILSFGFSGYGAVNFLYRTAKDTHDSGVRISGMNGQVEYKNPDMEQFDFAELGTVLKEGAHIKTGSESSCVLSFTDMSTFVLKAESEVVVSTSADPNKPKDSKFDLLYGNIKVNITKMIRDGSLNIKMNQAVAGAKGTKFVLNETGSASILQVVEGLVEFTNLSNGEKLDVSAGKQASVSGGKMSDLIDFDVGKEISLWNQDLAAFETGTDIGSRPKPTATASIFIPAADYVRGCGIAPASGAVGQYGQGVILNAAPYISRPNCAEYRFEAPEIRSYRLEIEYAAAQPRPLKVVLNGQTVNDAALSAATGCWTPDCQTWTVVGEYRLRAGSNTLLIERSDIFPHIRALRWTPM